LKFIGKIFYTPGIFNNIFPWKNINILKRDCHVGINVVFVEEILKLYDVRFMKNIFIAP
jgi:hypothetical protein